MRKIEIDSLYEQKINMSTPYLEEMNCMEILENDTLWEESFFNAFHVERDLKVLYKEMTHFNRSIKYFNDPIATAEEFRELKRGDDLEFANYQLNQLLNMGYDDVLNMIVIMRSGNDIKYHIGTICNIPLKKKSYMIDTYSKNYGGIYVTNISHGMNYALMMTRNMLNSNMISDDQKFVAKVYLYKRIGKITKKEFFVELKNSSPVSEFPVEKRLPPHVLYIKNLLTGELVDREGGK